MGNRYASHPPMRLPHKPGQWVKPAAAVRFVDARHASDSNARTERPPYQTIAHALTQVQAGETLLLCGGVYYEDVYVAVAGRSDSPITIRGCPGEIATIDGGRCPEFVESPGV